MSGDLWGPCESCGDYWEDYGVPEKLYLCPTCQAHPKPILGSIQNADLSLVKIVRMPSPIYWTLYCTRHGAMNRLTKDGLWRCVSAVGSIDDGTPQGKVIENTCQAGAMAI